MRKKIVAGNWKMNKTESETTQLIEELKQQDLKIGVEVFVAPTFVNLSCLLYTSPSPRDVEESRMPSSA